MNAGRASWRNMLMGFGFWSMAWPALRTGDLEALIHVAVVSHHLIQFTRACARGAGEASFYAPTIPSSAAKAS